MIRRRIKRLPRRLWTRPWPNFFRQTTALWLVQPKVELSGIKHLGTMLTGTYITLLPGQGKKQTRFVVADTEPNLSGEQQGLNLILEAARIGSLKKGSPVYYRQVKVGQVTGLELGPTAQNVWIHLVVFQKYRRIVRCSSRFWNAGGVRVIAGLFSGISVETESLESIVAGGIALATPDELGRPAKNGDHFILADNSEEEWLQWAPKIKLFTLDKSTSRRKKKVSAKRPKKGKEKSDTPFF
ncbi:MAG: MCE family protein [Candidatus Electrothrix sp. AR3]|nr:MCE family protein [Candidatus Electrothrix sp. AR3]